MFRHFFSPPAKVDIWKDSKINLPERGDDFCSASLRGFVDGFIMGFVVGGALGIMQGWVNDAKTKDLCMLSSSWAFNGAAIGAVAMTLGYTILQADMTPGLYTVR